MEEFLQQCVDHGIPEEQQNFFLEASGFDYDEAITLLKASVGSPSFKHGNSKESVDDVRAPIPPSKKGPLVEDHAPIVSHAPVVERNPFRFNSIRQSSSERKSKEALLEELFRPPVEITFVGDFNSAVKLAEKLGKWLLVNVQDETEFLCQILNRDVWSNERLKEFVVEHFVFWQPCNSSEEGRYYEQFYKIGSYPHIGIIDPATRGRFPQVFEGRIEAKELYAQLQEFVKNIKMNENQFEIETAQILDEAEPVTKKRATSDDVCEMSEKEMLELAISESLKYQQEEDDLELKEFLQEQELDVKKRKVSDDKEENEEQIPPHSNLDPDVTIGVRSPEGALEKFRLHSSDKLKYLIWLVARKFGTDKFDLWLAMPKLIVTELDMEMTVKEHGLQNTTLIMSKKD